MPDSRCIRVVTPDDHVNIGFHEVLIHDLADEEFPLVTLSERGCLHLNWPKTLFTFMSRYEFDLDQMRKECRERFGSTQSGTCTTYTAESGQAYRLIPHGAGTAVALPGVMVYSLEGHSAGLCRSYEEGA